MAPTELGGSTTSEDDKKKDVEKDHGHHLYFLYHSMYVFIHILSMIDVLHIWQGQQAKTGQLSVAPHSTFFFCRLGCGGNSTDDWSLVVDGVMPQVVIGDQVDQVA